MVQRYSLKFGNINCMRDIELDIYIFVMHVVNLTSLIYKLSQLSLQIKTNIPQ